MAIDSSATIHPSTIIEDGAEIGANAVIGPFCIIGAQVRIGADTELKSHVVVQGDTMLGQGNVVFPFAVLGEIPQDLKFGGEQTRLIIGDRNRIREGATMNTGTAGGGGVTRVGDDCLFMTGAHVGHDAQVGNHVIMANQSALAGHCIVSDNVIIGGLSGIHQFVRLGKGAIIGAVTMVTNDVVPFGLVQGPRGKLDGLNLVGLKRRGVAKDDINALRVAFLALAQGDGPFQERAQQIADEGPTSEYVREMVDFILGPSDRSFLTPS